MIGLELQHGGFAGIASSGAPTEPMFTTRHAT
jgi:hypothetical protein